MEAFQSFLLIILALFPGLVIGIYIYRIDKKRSTTVKMALIAVAYGMISACLAFAIARVLNRYTIIEEENMIHQMIRAVVFVGLVEEGCKFSFLRGILFQNPMFRKPFDGIIFAIMISMGFATFENFLYIWFGQGDTIVLRMFTAVPAHAIFALVMGFFIGEAKMFPTSRGLYSLMALAFATLAHGYYDYFLFLNFIPGVWLQPFISLAIVIVLAHVVFEHRKGEIIDLDD